MTRDWLGNGATRIIAILLGALLVAALFFAIYWLMPSRQVTYSDQVAAISVATTTPAPTFTVTHIATPDPLKAIYITACTASMESLRNKALSVFDGTELNAIVIDLKDYSGTISYEQTALQPKGVGQGCRISDLPQFIGELHARHIYTIGRITVFQDPSYAKQHPDLAIQSKSHPGSPWKDKNGLAYIDVGAHPYWDHVVDIAKEGHSIGFDELNFDYVRFPSDGDLADMSLTWDASTTKAEAVADFFAYLHSRLSQEGITASADLFGLTTSAKDDMGIGQILENALPYFDYIAPMVYPSHFASGYGGFTKPAEHPYEVINESMTSAVIRAVAASTSPNKLRPWLQDFNLGAIYTPAMVREQIQATYDSGLKSWMLWNAGSIYRKDEVTPSLFHATTTAATKKNTVD